MSMTRVLMLKRIFGLTLRAIQGFVDSIFTLMKVLLNCPDYTCINKRRSLSMSQLKPQLRVKLLNWF
ncbi:MAG: hypothetical protein G5663_06905 [Serratia symbiotica]|nr:hypothetical protein [Serratia symbiotica]